MSNWPFRFVHASDFHLEMPPRGVAEIPDHFRELFLEAASRAAERVFNAVLAEEADFLVLSGDLVDPSGAGPRGLLFLVEQFERLAERDIAVYWCGGRVDPPDAWPDAIRLPENVHVFDAHGVESFICQRNGQPIARVLGTSHVKRRRSRVRNSIRASDFRPDPNGLYTVAVAHGSACARASGDAQRLKKQSIDYWALGSEHKRSTLFASPDKKQMAHYSGSPQGREPEEPGPHGCTLLEVDAEGSARASLIPTDVLRWQNQRVVVEPDTSSDDLEQMLRQNLQMLSEDTDTTRPRPALLVSWTVAGTGPLLSDLRQGHLKKELLEGLQAEFGHRNPAVWSTELLSEPPALLPPQWYEQDTILGDFLRAVRQYQTASSTQVDVESFLSDRHVAGSSNIIVSALQLSDKQRRERVLRNVAMLGVDLLGSPEPAASVQRKFSHSSAERRAS